MQTSSSLFSIFSMKAISYNFGQVFNTTLKFVGFLCFMNLILQVNSNPTAAPMKQPNSDFQAPDNYFLPKDRALVPPAGPNPCIPRVAGKRSWPELVGEIGKAAAVKIERENPNVRAIIVVEGTPTPTKELKCDRVCIWIDPNGIVTRAPSVNPNPTAAPMKQPNSDFAANFQAPDHYFLPKDRALVPPAGPNPCIPRVGGKRSWPELVGEIGEAAAVKIERENPNVRAIIVVEGTPTPTKELKCDRVWVWINPNGVVTRAPSVRY